MNYDRAPEDHILIWSCRFSNKNRSRALASRPFIVSDRALRIFGGFL
jgi:hypothetical protein